MAKKQAENKKDFQVENGKNFQVENKKNSKKTERFGESVVIGENVEIDESVRVEGDCFFGDSCKILGCSRLENVVLGEGCVVENSVVQNSHFGKNCSIGPFANVRSGCIVGDDVRVGAFVELKNAIIANGCKMAHLSYVGDAELGEGVNVGCGVVFANYNGKIKQKSVIGNRVFIGCNVNIVAPVTIADETYICAGTTVTQDTQPGDFVIGRVRQENKQRKN